MKKLTTKITISLLLIMFINFNLISQMSTASFEFKVQPGAYVEHKITESYRKDGDQLITGRFWQADLGNGSIVNLNLTKGVKIRSDVNLVNNTGVFGTHTFFNVSEWNFFNTNQTVYSEIKTKNDTLSYDILSAWWSFPQKLPIYQRTSTRDLWENQAQWDPNIKVVGNKVNYEYRFNWTNDGLEQEVFKSTFAIQGGFAEFFSYIFLNRTEFQEVFSLNVESQYIAGFESYTVLIPLIIVGIVFRVSKNKKIK
ncbi:MAG: hypothetical protein ACW981_09715 [Candidatus Hodarchaeales archaeon]|jgi:hypothetical protein